MTKRKEEQLRGRLERKIDELSGKARRKELITEWSTEEMEQVQSRMDLDMTVLFVNTDFQTKRAVETALKLLNRGEYGICQECSNDINPKRLEAIPWTTLCVNCQEVHDHDVQYAKAA